MTERRDRIRVHIENKAYSVVGGDFQGMLAAVKQVAGRRFVSELKVWQLPGTAEEVEHQLGISGYELEGGTPVEVPAPAIDTSSEGSVPPANRFTVGGGDRIRVMVNGHKLSVVGGAFREMLEVVKALPGRRFDGEAKVWEIPGDVGVIKGMIEAAGFQLEGAENISITPTPNMEPPDFAVTSQNPPPAPAFAAPEFLDEPPWNDDEIPDLEPPDWWDEDSMPPPDMQYEEPLFDEPDPFTQNSFPPSTTVSSPPDLAPGLQATGDRIRIRLGDTPLVITGGTFQAMLAAVKNIPGRRFNGDDKVWEIPEDTTLDSVNQAMSAAGFTVLPG